MLLERRSRSSGPLGRVRGRRWDINFGGDGVESGGGC